VLNPDSVLKRYQGFYLSDNKKMFYFVLTNLLSMKLKTFILNYIIKNKFILTAVVFCLWILFFDTNNLIERFSQSRKIENLKKSKEYYIQKINDDSLALHELMTNKQNLERFVREKYFMKRDNEDVYVIVDEQNIGIESNKKEN